MELEHVNPRLVWGWYQSVVGVSKSLVEYISKFGWEDIPPVPVFKIPNIPEMRKKHAYVLIDGNKRRNVAKYLNQFLPIAIYGPEEIIDFIRDGLAQSRNLTDPRRYQKAIYLYSIRPRLPQISSR